MTKAAVDVDVTVDDFTDDERGLSRSFDSGSSLGMNDDTARENLVKDLKLKVKDLEKDLGRKQHSTNDEMKRKARDFSLQRLLL